LMSSHRWTWHVRGRQVHRFVALVVCAFGVGRQTTSVARDAMFRRAELRQRAPGPTDYTRSNVIAAGPAPPLMPTPSGKIADSILQSLQWNGDSKPAHRLDPSAGAAAGGLPPDRRGGGMYRNPMHENIEVPQLLGPSNAMAFAPRNNIAAGPAPPLVRTTSERNPDGAVMSAMQWEAGLPEPARPAIPNVPAGLASPTWRRLQVAEQQRAVEFAVEHSDEHVRGGGGMIRRQPRAQAPLVDAMNWGRQSTEWSRSNIMCAGPPPPQLPVRQSSKRADVGVMQALQWAPPARPANY